MWGEREGMAARCDNWIRAGWWAAPRHLLDNSNVTAGNDPSLIPSHFLSLFPSRLSLLSLFLPFSIPIAPSPRTTPSLDEITQDGKNVVFVPPETRLSGANSAQKAVLIRSPQIHNQASNSGVWNSTKCFGRQGQQWRRKLVNNGERQQRRRSWRGQQRREQQLCSLRIPSPTAEVQARGCLAAA